MILTTFESTVAGIPCQIEVDVFIHVPPHRGSPHSCDSDVDYYGYTEVGFSVMDRRGRYAAWLERKMTEDERERIERECVEQMRGEV